MILGAVLAGGQSVRFGRDKALVAVDGRAMIDRVIAALGAQCDAVVVAGRTHPGSSSLADRPEPGQGPLGGINAALHYAAENGYDAVLSAPCDMPDLPLDLADRLGALDTAPAYLADQPVIGLWPAALAGALDAWLAAQAGRAMMGWIDRIGARAVTIDAPLWNINTPAEWAAWEQRHGI